MRFHSGPALTIDERYHVEPIAPVGMSGEPKPADFSVVGLQGNSTTLVRLSCGSHGGSTGFLIVSRERRAQASLKAASGGEVIAALEPGDYLVEAKRTSPAGAPPAVSASRRILVHAGRAYSYEVPRALPAVPRENVTGSAGSAAPPSLRRLAYLGAADGAARIVADWSTDGAQCVCIRSRRWGEHWLPYRVGSSAVVLCLLDGAYELRAAKLGDDGSRAGRWSDVVELVVAEGRLAAAPSIAAGALVDWLDVRVGWRPRGAVNVEFRAIDDNNVSVRIAWDPVGGPSGIRYLICYRAEHAGRWENMICEDTEHTLSLAPGLYRIRVCAVDDVVFLRSEFFGETMVSLAISDAPVTLHDLSSSLIDASPGWEPLANPSADPEHRDHARFAEFEAVDIALLSGEPSPTGLDLNAVLCGRSREVGERGRDIAVTREFARGLTRNQMAAAGDYLFCTGQIDDARLVFEEFGRQFRGVDFARLRLGQVASVSGSGIEASDLLSLADTALRAATAKVNELTMQLAVAKLGTAAEELRSLRHKAQQYDELIRDLPALRDKAPRHKDLKDQLSARRSKAARHDRGSAGWRKRVFRFLRRSPL